MKISTLLEEIYCQFPPESAMNGDKIGMQVSTDNTNVNGILITMEVNDEVIDECVKLNYNVILTFHPLIYFPIAEITQNERVGRLCSKLIKHSINLISIHTAFDAYQYGTNYILAEKLNLQTISFLAPTSTDATNSKSKLINTGIGVITKPENPLTVRELLVRLQNVCGGNIKYCGDDLVELNKIAIVGGSGSSFVNEVIANNCDCFITADISYHLFHAALGHFTLIDIGHYEMEQFVPCGIANALSDFLIKNEINYKTSTINTNPVKYLN